MESIEKEFRQQLSNNSLDQDFLLVYSDWLQEQGDPRGEIIILEHVLASESRENKEGIQSRLDSLMKNQLKALNFSVETLDHIELSWTTGAVIKVTVLSQNSLIALGHSISQTGQWAYLIELYLHHDVHITELPNSLGELSQLGCVNL